MCRPFGIWVTLYMGFELFWLHALPSSFHGNGDVRFMQQTDDFFVISLLFTKGYYFTVFSVCVWFFVLCYLL